MSVTILCNNSVGSSYGELLGGLLTCDGSDNVIDK